jgi:hypothetical protein
MTIGGVANTSNSKAANDIVIVAIARRHIHLHLIHHLATKALNLVIDVPVSVERIGTGIVHDNIIVIVIADKTVTLAEV